MTQNALVHVGQMTHTITSRLTIMSEGYKVRSIKPLERDDAIKKGADFIGESFVFSVAVGVVVVDNVMKKNSDEKKSIKQKEKIQKEKDELDNQLNSLDARLKALEKIELHNRMKQIAMAANSSQTSDNEPVETNQTSNWRFW